MEQPSLPVWLSYTTFVDPQGSLTTGIVQLPLTYSGPSIPLSWPWVAAGDEGGAMRVSLLGGTGFQTLDQQTWIVAQTQAGSITSQEGATPIATALPNTPTADPMLEPTEVTNFGTAIQQTDMTAASPESLEATLIPTTFIDGQVSFLMATPSSLFDGRTSWIPVATYPALASTIDNKQSFVPAVYTTNADAQLSTVPATLTVVDGRPTIQPVQSTSYPAELTSATPSVGNALSTVTLPDGSVQTATGTQITVSDGSPTISLSLPTAKSPGHSPSATQSQHLSPGQTVGIALGTTVFALLLLGLCAMCFVSRRRQLRRHEFRRHRWEAIPEMQEAHYFDDEDAVMVPRGGYASSIGSQKYTGELQGSTVGSSQPTQSSTLASTSTISPQRFPPGARSASNSTGNTFSDSLPSRLTLSSSMVSLQTADTRFNRDSTLFYTLPVANRMRAVSSQTQQTPPMRPSVDPVPNQFSSPDTMVFPTAPKAQREEFGVIKIHRRALSNGPLKGQSSPPADIPEDMPLLAECDEHGQRFDTSAKGVNHLLAGLGLAGSLFDKTIWQRERRAASLNDAYLADIRKQEAEHLSSPLFDADAESDSGSEHSQSSNKGNDEGPALLTRWASVSTMRKGSMINVNSEERQSLIPSIGSASSPASGNRFHTPVQSVRSSLTKRDRRAVSEGA